MTGLFRQFFFGTLRRKLITGVATVHAVMMSLFIWDLVEKQHDMLLHQQTQLATSLTESVATSSAAWLATRDIVGMQEIIDAQRRYPELIYAMILDKQGKVMGHTDTVRRGQLVKDLPRLDQLQILSRDEKLVDIIGPVYIDRKHIGWVRVGIGQMTTRSELGNITRIGLLYAMAAIIDLPERCGLRSR